MEKKLSVNTRIAVLFLSITTCFIQSGCKKFIEIEPPNTSLTGNTLFQEDKTANAAIVPVYNVLGTFMAYPISSYAGWSADELAIYTVDVPSIQFFKNNLRPDNNGLQSLWGNFYKNIYQTNLVIEGLSDNQLISTAVKKQLLGEAKFARAYHYFYLVNLFGEVPLITTTDYKLNAVAANAPKSEIMNLVKDDLLEARELLSNRFVGADGISLSQERIRPTRYAASALLARVYLYNNEFDKAETEATNVIGNVTDFSLNTSNLNQVFLKNSREAIWQIAGSEVLIPNTLEGYSYIFLTADPRDAAISKQLLNAFEPGDKRKKDWIGTIDSILYFPYKYKILYSPISTEYSMALRLAEQYLIRAEARAQQNKVTEAQADLNIIRNRAGLANTSANDKASLLLAVEQERRVELFTEWGHRWLDLKRTGRTAVVMPGVAVIKQTTWNTHAQLFPIPQVDMNTNPNLKQNPGY